MSSHNLCYGSKIREKYTHINPSFTVLKWGIMGYILLKYYPDGHHQQHPYQHYSSLLFHIQVKWRHAAADTMEQEADFVLAALNEWS